MEIIFELFLEVFMEVFIFGICKLWTKGMRRINPDYDDSRSTKIITNLIGIILIIVVITVFCLVIFSD